MARTVLVTGASGLLGRDIVKTFGFAGWNVVGTALKNVNPPAIVKLDLEDGGEIKAVLDNVKPDVVVHSAANRFPDQCTSDPTHASAVNVDATATLARLTSARSIILLYISTDYVFPGRPGEAPYRADSPTDPTNVYGRTKRDGERAVLEHTSPTSGTESQAGVATGVVLRVPLLYGHAQADQSTSAVHPLLDAVYKAQEANKEGGVKVKVDDWALRYPTCTEDVARVCLDVATLYADSREGSLNAEKVTGPGGRGKEELPRILQFSAEERFTKYEMCAKLAEILGLPIDGLERHDPSGDEGATARPYDCHLDTAGLKEVGISVNCVNFNAWWTRELRAFRH